MKNENLSSPVDLIKRSVVIFFDKNNLPQFLLLYSILAPFIIFSSLQLAFPGMVQDSMWVNVVLSIVNIIYFIFYFWTGIAGIIAVKTVVTGEKIKFKTVLKESLRVFWPFVGLSVLLFLIIFGGVLLLIIPAVVFGIWFSLSKFILIDTKAGIKNSLSESRKLIKGRFWQILWRFFVFAIFGVGLQAIFSFLPYGIGSGILVLAGVLFIIPSYLLYTELKDK